MLLPLLINLSMFDEAAVPTVITVFGMPNEPGVMTFQITIAEIVETTDLDGVLIWDQDAWDTGKVWGS